MGGRVLRGGSGRRARAGDAGGRDGRAKRNRSGLRAWRELLPAAASAAPEGREAARCARAAPEARRRASARRPEGRGCQRRAPWRPCSAPGSLNTTDEVSMRDPFAGGGDGGPLDAGPGRERRAGADDRAGARVPAPGGSRRIAHVQDGAAARRDGQRQDRDLPAPRATRDRARRARADAGAGDRADAGARRAVARAVRRSRRHSAQRALRRRAPRSVASHPPRRRGHRHRHAVGGVRAARTAGARHRG